MFYKYVYRLKTVLYVLQSRPYYNVLPVAVLLSVGEARAMHSSISKKDC